MKNLGGRRHSVQKFVPGTKICTGYKKFVPGTKICTELLGKKFYDENFQNAKNLSKINFLLI